MCFFEALSPFFFFFGFGISDTSILLFADFPPMILTENEEVYSAVEGKRVMMHCKVFSSPPPAISWYVGSLFLSPSDQ